MKAVSFVAILLWSSGCATSFKGKFWQSVATGAAVGAIYGSTKPQSKQAYTTMWGATGAAAGAILATTFNDPEYEQNRLKSEIASLNAQLATFSPKMTSKGNSLYSKALPKELSGLVEPGEWKHYKLDQWVQDPMQSNTWYRQVEMFEIIPPTSK